MTRHPPKNSGLVLPNFVGLFRDAHPSFQQNLPPDSKYHRQKQHCGTSQKGQFRRARIIKGGLWSQTHMDPCVLICKMGGQYQVIITSSQSWGHDHRECCGSTRI